MVCSGVRTSRSVSFQADGKPQTVCRFQDQAASCCTSPRSRAARSAGRRTDSSTGSSPQASRGGRSCPSARRTGPARRTPARPRSPPTPAISRSPKRASRPTSSRLSSRESATGSRTGLPSPAPARSPTRCASTGNGARSARYAAERGVKLFGDIPIYVARERRRRGSAPELFQHGLVAGRAARRPVRGRPALGQPAVRLGRDAHAGLPLVDRAATPDVRALSTLPA